MFKGIGNLFSMMKQASQLNEKMQAVGERLKQQRATGSAGGGMVEVEVNGVGEVLRVTIDPLLIERREREMIEDLLPAAINQAVAKSRQMHLEAMKSVTEGLDLPGMEQAFEQLGGKGAPWLS